MKYRNDHTNKACKYDPEEIVANGIKFKDFKKRIKKATLFLIGSIVTAVITLFIKTKFAISESFDDYLSILFFCCLAVIVTAVFSVITNILHYIITLDVESKASQSELDQITVDLSIIVNSVKQILNPKQRVLFTESLKQDGASEGLVEVFQG